MKKWVGLLALVSFVTIFAAADFEANKFKGYDQYGGNVPTNMAMGVRESYVVTVASADANADSTAAFGAFCNCRAISCDVSGIMKFDTREFGGTASTVVMQMTAGVIYPIRNVMKVYQHYTGTTDVTAQVYANTGVAAVGIRLWR